jgi:hypothetical protein
MEMARVFRNKFSARLRTIVAMELNKRGAYTCHANIDRSVASWMTPATPAAAAESTESAE